MEFTRSVSCESCSWIACLVIKYSCICRGYTFPLRGKAIDLKDVYFRVEMFPKKKSNSLPRRLSSVNYICSISCCFLMLTFFILVTSKFYHLTPIIFVQCPKASVMQVHLVFKALLRRVVETPPPEEFEKHVAMRDMS